MAKSKVVLMKKGEFTKEKKTTGVLFRNLLHESKLGVNTTHLLPDCKTQKFGHKGYEVHVMLKGEVEFKIGAEKYIIQEGDVLYHESKDPHRAKNTGSEEAIYITISTPYTFGLK